MVKFLLSLTIYRKFPIYFINFVIVRTIVCPMSNSEHVKISTSHFYVVGTTACCITLPNYVESEDN